MSVSLTINKFIVVFCLGMFFLVGAFLLALIDGAAGSYPFFNLVMLVLAVLFAGTVLVLSFLIRLTFAVEDEILEKQMLIFKKVIYTRQIPLADIRVREENEVTAGGGGNKYWSIKGTDSDGNEVSFLDHFESILFSARTENDFREMLDSLS